jgi:hypothetical protein
MRPELLNTPRGHGSCVHAAIAGRGLDVYFLTEEILDAEGRAAGPEFTSGAGFRVAITSAADGSATSCSD